jgi:hypothetical protein
VLCGAPLLSDVSSKARCGTAHACCLSRCADAPPQFVADRRPGALAAWSWAHLSRVLGAEEEEAERDEDAPAPTAPTFPCYVSAPGKDRFIICDDAKNVCSSPYFIRVRARCARMHTNAWHRQR